MLTSYFSELTVHTWDLAAATGQHPHWDDTVVTAALEARQILPAENRRAVFEEISAAMGLDEVAIPFAEAVPVARRCPRHRSPRRLERPGSPSLTGQPGVAWCPPNASALADRFRRPGGLGVEVRRCSPDCSDTPSARSQRQTSPSGSRR